MPPAPNPDLAARLAEMKTRAVKGTHSQFVDLRGEIILLLDSASTELADARRELDALRARVATLEAGLREIATGKTHADNESVLGEWGSMALRFHKIAKDTLAEART